MPRFTIDTMGWPLIVNDKDGSIIAKFPLPDGSEGDDAEGKAQVARAHTLVRILNEREKQK